ncbi:MAG: hypothetical protein WBN81_17780 [Gammaproteobacteria bacterium]
MNTRYPRDLSAALLLATLQSVYAQDTPGRGVNVEPLAAEKHFKNLRQLTFGGQNAEAYFSRDGTELIFQSTRDELACDPNFRMGSDGSHLRWVWSGQGRNQCIYYRFPTLAAGFYRDRNNPAVMKRPGCG